MTSVLRRPAAVLALLAIALAASHSYAANYIRNNAAFTGPANTTSTPIIPYNRSFDWSLAGVPGGIPQIPAICANVLDAPYNAIGNGVYNDTSAVQNAVNACPYGEAVYFPPGNYLLNALTIYKSVVLVGAGPNRTTLLIGQHPIETNEDNPRPIGPAYGGYIVYNWTAGYGKGTNTITLNSVANISVGNVITLDELNPAFVSDNGYGGVQNCGRSPTGPYNGSGRCLQQAVLVTAISGNSVSISPSLDINFNSTLDPQAWFWPEGYIKGVGIANLTMIGTRNNSYALAVLWNCQYCWVNNTNLLNTSRDAVQFWTGFRNEVSNNYIANSKQPYGPTRYGIEMWDNGGMLIQNNLFDKIVSGVVFAGGNEDSVVAYNFFNVIKNTSSPIGGDVALHETYNHDILVEGNIGNSFESDDYWGSSGYNLLLRNRFTGYRAGQWYWGDSIPVILENMSRYYTVIGNIFGTRNMHIYYETPNLTSGNFSYDGEQNYIYTLGWWNYVGNVVNFDPFVENTLIRQGNWDVVSNRTVWNPSIPNQSIPASLYLSGKPSWWGSLPWPATGPSPTDPNTLLYGEIPAEVRFYKMYNLTFGTYQGNLTANAPASTATTVSPGTGITLTAQASGGTKPYLYTWYHGPNTGGCLNIRTLGETNSGIDTYSDTYITVPNASGYYCYQVMDSSLPAPEILYSGTLYVAVSNSSTSSTTSTTTSTSSSTTTIPANTVYAKSCSEPDVASAIGSAGSNYTVIVPAGTCTWSSTLEVNKSVKIIGGGEMATTILDYVNQAGILNVNLPSSSSFFRLSSMSIEPSPNENSSMVYTANGGHSDPVYIGGTCSSSTCSTIRLDHLRFINWKYETGSSTDFGGFLVTVDDVYGVLDHINVTATTFGEFITVGYNSYQGIGNYGDNSWAQPDYYGSANMIYIENSTFIDTGNEFALTDSDNGNAGGRFVVRHNTLVDFVVANHGTETSGRARGGRLMEVYDNNFTCTDTPIGGQPGNCNDFVGMRSGTALVFNNIINIYKGAWLNYVVSLNAYRSFSGFAPWGYCAGQGTYDLNNATVYATGTISNAVELSNGTLVVTDSSKSWSAGQWVDYGMPYSVVDTSINLNATWPGSKHPGYEIDGSNATSLSSVWYGSDYWNGPPKFSPGDTYEILRAPVCIDQSGRGQGALLSSNYTDPTPSGWVNETLDPVYEWADKINGTITHAIVGSDTLRIINNRDYYYQNSTFNGLSGTGSGLLANRPTTCTPYVAYWATDANGGNGELYKCTASNTWTAFYTPYQYPYPLDTNNSALTTVSTTTSTTTTSATTTVVSSGGGGGGGGSSGSSGGSGGAGGGGGSSKPVVIPISNGYIITNIAQLNTVSISACNTTVSMLDNFITPTYSGLTVNGKQYTISSGIPVQLELTTGARCSLLLLNTSYLPILQTVTVEVYSNASRQGAFSKVVRVNDTGEAAYSIGLLNASVSMYLTKGLATPQYTYANLYAAQVNSTLASSYGSPKGYSESSEINLSLYGIGQLRSNLTIPIGPNTMLVPFRLANGTDSWKEANYSIYGNAMVVKALNGTGILGLFAQNPVSSTATTSVAAATVSIETTATTSIPESIKRIPYGQYVIGAAIFIVGALAIYVGLGMMEHGLGRPRGGGAAQSGNSQRGQPQTASNQQDQDTEGNGGVGENGGAGQGGHDMDGEDGKEGA